MENKNVREASAGAANEQKKRKKNKGMSSSVSLFTSPHTWLDWLRPMFFFTVF
jgi:hypothetical protein